MGLRLPWILAAICVLAIAYYLTARLGLAFAIPPGNATAVWPPSGIALSALIIYGWRICPGIWIGAFLVNRGTQLSFAACLGIATGNTLEALISLWLCQRFLDLDAPFRHVKCGFRLISIGALACTVAATVGAGCLAYGGHIDWGQFLPNWSTWWLGDLAGVMLITPVFLCMPWRSASDAYFRTTVEAVLPLLFLGIVSQGVFGGWLSEDISEGLLYLPLIVVFGMLLRFRPIVVFVGNLLISSVAILGASRGVGPFVTEAVTQSLFELQLFMTLSSLAGLTLVGILTTQREAQKRELKLAARIQAGEELRMREAELAHVSRLSTMGEMVAGIAHEINQPLYAIANFAGASERMLKDSENEKADRLRGLNRQIADQAVRAGEIIRRLREFVGKTDGSRSPFAVNDVVRDAAQLLTSEAQRKHVSLRIEAADNPSLIVCADKVQIEQVLVNLIRNSFDAMQDTDAGNRVATLWTSLTDGEVRITVEDKGVGVPEDRASKLFDAFFTTKESGMGMGLAVSRSIVEAHGGRIWAIPNAEVGTSFTVALPYHQREP